MPAIRHCRHCWGDCPGDCLLPGDPGGCIHARARLPLRQRARLLLWRVRRA